MKDETHTESFIAKLLDNNIVLGVGGNYNYLDIMDRLEALIKQKQKEARIDELRLRKAHNQPEQDWIDKRIKELEAK